MRLTITLLLFFCVFFSTKIKACSVIYYVDTISGKIFIANNEDYWYDTKAYIRITPRTTKQFARLWYGWDNFAQGGINEVGLFFDGAVTPEDKIPDGYGRPIGNLGDDILANCSTIKKAIDYLEKKKVALTNAHLMFGDSTGNAVVVEWVEGERKLNWISDNKLIMTNFLLSDTVKGNYPCYRYNLIQDNIEDLQQSQEEATLRTVGNILAKAVQLPVSDKTGKIGGTLYSTFIDITNMEFMLVYKLDNTKITKLDLKEEFQKLKKRKIKLE